MRKFDPIFPGYKLKDHKGYSTQSHKAIIKEQKHTIIHRMSFFGSYKLLNQ